VTCLWPKAWNRSSNSLFVLDAVSQKQRLLFSLLQSRATHFEGCGVFELNASEADIG